MLKRILGLFKRKKRKPTKAEIETRAKLADSYRLLRPVKVQRTCKMYVFGDEDAKESEIRAVCLDGNIPERDLTDRFKSLLDAAKDQIDAEVSEDKPDSGDTWREPVRFKQLNCKQTEELVKHNSTTCLELLDEKEEGKDEVQVVCRQTPE